MKTNLPCKESHTQDKDVYIVLVGEDSIQKLNLDNDFVPVNVDLYKTKGTHIWLVTLSV